MVQAPVPTESLLINSPESPPTGIGMPRQAQRERGCSSLLPRPPPLTLSLSKGRRKVFQQRLKRSLYSADLTSSLLSKGRVLRGSRLKKRRTGMARPFDSLTIAERLALADPSNAGWQKDLLQNYGKLLLVSPEGGCTADKRLEAAEKVLVWFDQTKALDGDAQMPEIRRFFQEYRAKRGDGPCKEKDSWLRSEIRVQRHFRECASHTILLAHSQASSPPGAKVSGLYHNAPSMGLASRIHPALLCSLALQRRGKRRRTRLRQRCLTRPSPLTAMR